MRAINAYQCDFCSYYKKTKKSVEVHEANCFMNPINRACASCKHNTFDQSRYPNPNYCERKEIALTNKSLTKNCPLWEKTNKQSLPEVLSTPDL